jgi:enterochelin esterase-like enzyme
MVSTALGSLRWQLTWWRASIRCSIGSGKRWLVVRRSLHHSDVFGNVLSLSGSYLWFPGLFEGAVPPDRNAEPGWLTRQFVTSPSLPIRFYLAAGRFENGYPISLLTETRRFRDVLEAKGCTAQYREYNGGHDVLGWRGPFVEGLTALIMEK